VPIEQLEAAQLDGTSAWQRFINVTVPVWTAEQYSQYCINESSSETDPEER